MNPPSPLPPCDLCEGAEPAIMSLMNLADYSQVKIGAVCAPPFFEGLAAQIRGPGDGGGQAVPDNEDDGYSGNDSAGALTASDIEQIERAAADGPGGEQPSQPTTPPEPPPEPVGPSRPTRPRRSPSG